MKVKRSIKDAAKKGNKDVCRILAKEIVNSRKAISKMYASKAQLNSVEMSMKNQLGMLFLYINLIIKRGLIRNDLYDSATLRMAGALEKSTEVMQYMQKLVKIPEIQASMMEMSKEMMKVSK